MKNSKKLFGATVTLLIAFFAVVTSTYAWFTVNNAPEIGNIKFGTTEGDGVYMSLDRKTWQNSIDGDELYEFLGLYTVDEKGKHVYTYTYDDVTPTAAEDGFQAKFNYLSYTNSMEYNKGYYSYTDCTEQVLNYGWDSQEVPEVAEINEASESILENGTTTAGYISFNLFFKSVKDVDLYLYGLSVAPESSDNAADVQASKMARLGFAKPHGAPKKTDLLRIVNPTNIGKADIDGATDVKVTEGFYSKEYIRKVFRDLYNNSDNAKDFLVEDPKAENKDVKGTFTSYKFNPENNDVKNMATAIEKSYNIKGLITGNFDYKKEQQVTITSKKSQVGDALINIPAFDSEENNYVTLTVFLWLEAWDNNATDEAQKGQFTMNFKFVGVPTAAEFASEE